MPGMVNTHTHLSEALIPGMGSEKTLYEWGRDIIAPVGRNLTTEIGTRGDLAQGRRDDPQRNHLRQRHVRPFESGFEGLAGGGGRFNRAGLRGTVSFGAEDARGEDTSPPMSVDEVLAEHEELARMAEQSEMLDFR